jgi:hypothetical protein
VCCGPRRSIPGRRSSFSILWRPSCAEAGHSQDVDPNASQVAAFFARLLVPIDFTPGAEARVASLSPMALYSGFVADLGARYEAARPFRETNPG